MKTKFVQVFLKPAFMAGAALAIVGISQFGVTAAQEQEVTEPSSIDQPAENRVLALDGEQSFLRVPDSPWFHAISNSITLEAWCMAQSFYPNTGSVNSIMRKNAQAGLENFFLRIRNRSGPRLVEMGLGVKLGILQAPAEIRTGEWYHLAGTYDGQTLAVYVNGVKIQSESVSGNLTIDDSDLLIGKGDPDFSSGEYFHGLLDEIRVWNVSRTQAEIQNALDKPLTGKEAGLVAYWNFDDGTAKDLSGHAIHGRLEGKARIVQATRSSLSSTEFQTPVIPAIETEGLALKKRLEVVEALWRNLREIYPALEYKGIRGREWIEPALLRVRQIKSDREFREFLQEQMASLRDTHTRILSYPGQPRWISPPVMLARVEGKVAVIRAHQDTTLVAGDVLMSVEDRPIEECLAEKMRRVCNSTERGRAREACGQLLAGPPGTTVTVHAAGADGQVRPVTLRRESHPDFWKEPAMTSRSCGESIGYIRISRWTDATIPEQFDQALDMFKACRGLIIDVRGNGGGHDQLADVVNGRLTAKPVVSSIDFWRKPGTDQYQRTIGWVQPRGPWIYQGRVAVLIDEAAMSACEHFVSGIEAMGCVLLVGEPTNGAGGGPTSIELPDGTRVAISRALGLRANGVVFEGHGIPPHIFSEPTLKDLREGRDAVLEIAKEWIESGKDLPPRTQALRTSM
ncbi:MAG TPA: S41 family peptidase [Candidatus Paceibacterota bacterium]|nr:S41 family peptidase [Verrucomicrobiota bacterium]HRY46711.1 S41 family peptidase [Candidatus Paceibacterota bacterium]HSA02959.1 S41 family peptidase [Candidatus Paceibacterota bacterium]